MLIQSREALAFQNEPIPTDTNLVGYSALVDALQINAPVRWLSCVSAKHVRGTRRQEGNWHVFDKRFKPDNTLRDHLEFALRHEHIDLLLLKRIFDAVSDEKIIEIVQATPTGINTRRIWFFFEELTGRLLPIGDAPMVKSVDALDPKLYFTTNGKLSQRHRVYDNLLGTPAFCPIIRRTKMLQSYIELDLATHAHAIIGKVGGHVFSRAASFLLLADSKASFAIEGEHPQTNRLQRWGKAILEVGKRYLNQTEIYRLHRILIGDNRFTKVGYRDEGVFLGERDHNYEPLPEFIGAKPSDIVNLMLGLNTCNNRLRISDIDPVLQAAAIAFGFVYIHPMADGNGRLHRCLVHHVLIERGFSPKGMVFPISSVMLDQIDVYRSILQAHSAPLMNHIEWRSTPNRNVEVTNDTNDLYRFYDCTAEAEFLYDCVKQTIEIDLPREIAYLISNDTAKTAIMSNIEMPDQMVSDLIMHIRQNDGKLSKKRRNGAFSALTDAEVDQIETIINDAFSKFDVTCKA